MPRVHAVAYDLSAGSPAQPRLAALFRRLHERGVGVELWTERPAGAWIDELVAKGGVRVHVLADPVLRVYRALGGWRRQAAPTTSESAPPAVATRSRPSTPGVLWRMGQRVQRTLLFPDQQRLWTARVRRRLLAVLDRDDVVLTCARPESAALVGAAAKRRGACWWLDFADGWCFQGLRPDAMVAGGRRERELVLERRLVADADVVSTVNDELGGYFAGLRADGDVTIFPNIVPDELMHLPHTPRVRAAGEMPTVGYFGRLSLSDPERTLSPLLRMLRPGPGESDLPRAAFRFHGDYSPRDRGEIGELEALGHPVRVEKPVSREALAAMRAQFDAALVVASPGQRGSSSKLLDTLGLGLPVLALVPVPSLAARIVTDAGCGEVVEIGAAAESGARWRRFVGVLGTGGYRVDPAVRARYTSAAVVSALVDRVTSLLGPAAR